MKKAVLVTIRDDWKETKILAQSLNLEICTVIKQRRRHPDPRYYVGVGKAKEIAEIIEKKGVDLIIIDGNITPAQHYRLERLWKITVWDRIYLILNIFMERAQSREAKLQVELARLMYEIPLVKEWVNKSKSGEHPGFMAGGAYKIDQYLELIKRRERIVKRKLEIIKKRKKDLILSRKKRNFYLVSIAGYTNAGKSSIAKMISRANVKVGVEAFSTISTKTSRLKSDDKILITDTVGFVQDLPPWLIDAFHATLEELFTADLILLVVDLSEDCYTIERKALTCYDIIREGHAKPKIIIVGNKIDIAKDVVKKAKKLSAVIPGAYLVLTSATKNWGIENLIRIIKCNLTERYTLIACTDGHADTDALILFNTLLENMGIRPRRISNGSIVYRFGSVEMDRIVCNILNKTAKEVMTKSKMAKIDTKNRIKIKIWDNITSEYLTLQVFPQTF